MRSGNGAIAPQFLYILVSMPIPVLCKIGISNKVSRRTDEVSKRIIGWAVPVFFVFIPYGWHLEQSIHRVFSFANVPFGGSREWFWLPVAPFVLVVMLVHQIFWAVVAMGLMFGVMWVFTGCPEEPLKAFISLLHNYF